MTEKKKRKSKISLNAPDPPGSSTSKFFIEKYASNGKLVVEDLLPVGDPVEAEKGPEVKAQAQKEGFMAAATSKALRPFVIISSSYLLFTITDGAIRMIVLLHAYNKSFSALEVTIMFTLYELAGVFTNLVSSSQI
jgi:hypothetical protein